MALAIHRNTIILSGVLILIFHWYTLLQAGDIYSIPKFSESVRIDGALSETVWKEALRIEDFHTYYPLDGEVAPDRTVALFGYNEESFFAAFICLDRQPELIRASISPRDQILDDDHITLFLDTFNNGKESYEFCFNPFGIQQDGLYIDMMSLDFTPDFIFYSEGRLFEDGYIIEVEIPFKSLRFPSANRITWGFSIMRSVKHLSQDFISPKISLNSTTFIPQFSKLTGFEGINSGKNIEVLPEFTSSQQGSLDPVTEEFSNEEFKFSGGLNLKYGLTSNIVFDMAFNPDFSQVEADADIIDVNRRFPFYYDEKRPFFLESTNIYKTPVNVLYTRSIVDPIAGLKFSGKGGGFELGILQGVDEYYGSSEYLEEISATQKYYFEPTLDDSTFIEKYKGKKSVHSILRIKKNIGGYSHIGAIVSDTRMHDIYSYTYGLDGNFLIANEYILTFQALNSQTKFFFDDDQRGDPAFHLNLFRGSRTFNFQLTYNDIYPEFEVKNGFLERKDYREGSVQLWYDFRQSDSFFGLIRPTFYLSQMYNHASQKIESYIAPSVTIEAKGNNTLTLGLYRQFEEYAGFNFDKNWYYIQFINQTFSWLFFNIRTFLGDAIYYDALYYGLTPFLGEYRYINFDMEIRPLKNWSVILGLKNYLFNGKKDGIDYRTNQDIYRLRTTYQFTRELGMRFIAEYNNLLNDFDLNALFSYQPFPGTVFFFGYNDHFQDYSNIYIDYEKNKYIRDYRGLFMKLSYLFRF